MAVKDEFSIGIIDAENKIANCCQELLTSFHILTFVTAVNKAFYEFLPNIIPNLLFRHHTESNDGFNDTLTMLVIFCLMRITSILYCQ